MILPLTLRDVKILRETTTSITLQIGQQEIDVPRDEIYGTIPAGDAPCAITVDGWWAHANGIRDAVRFTR